MFRSIVASLCLIFFVGCSDYNLSLIPEETEPPVLAPEIDVTPAEHGFGAIDANGYGDQIIISISNIGNDTLTLDGVSLVNGDSTFTLSALPVSSLEPWESTDLAVTYNPDTYETNSDIVSILSNDEDEPDTWIPVGGSGDAPVIEITPEYYDFGSVFLGCDDTLEVVIGNVGNVSLEISDVEYFASLPADFGLGEYEAEHGPLPWTMTPGETISLDVLYMPLDIYDDSAYIEVVSSDPLNPIVTADHDGLGDYESYVTDNFEQDGMAITDILFVIDNSGSMWSNQLNFKNNFDSFIAVFSSAGVDYQIAFITTDDENFVDGAIVTSASTDPITEVGDIIDNIGTTGSAMEKGLYYSYLATQPGADAGIGSTFLRSDAKLAIIYVSDEPDGSSAYVTPSEVSSHLGTLKSSSSMVAAHAVAGDYPSGCSTNGGAQFGDGYYDVVNDLGGTFMSICASDWGTQMDTLARESMALMDFPLSGEPIEDTIEVLVDGSVSTDWTYSSTSNSVTFTIAPADGSLIDISYAVWADCSEDLDEDESQ
ncbi:hypothetical protein CMI47_01890 [Candidatus Pacearchaeota archaeon]|nr:hypothetical protein [Candidatus Pacearchaeota archaeon]